MSELIIFQPDPQSAVQVRMEGETVWLTPEQMAEVFGRERSVITTHLRNILREGELELAATCAKFAHVQMEGQREVRREVEHYKLDAILSVGYRVNAKRATQFRQWASTVLREHLTRGFSLDCQRFEQNAAESEATLALVRKTAQAPRRSEPEHRRHAGAQRCRPRRTHAAGGRISPCAKGNADPADDEHASGANVLIGCH